MTRCYNLQNGIHNWQPGEIDRRLTATRLNSRPLWQFFWGLTRSWLSASWAVGLLGYQSCVLSVFWSFGLLGWRHNGVSLWLSILNRNDKFFYNRSMLCLPLSLCASKELWLYYPGSISLHCSSDALMKLLKLQGINSYRYLFTSPKSMVAIKYTLISCQSTVAGIQNPYPQHRFNTAFTLF